MDSFVLKGDIAYAKEDRSMCCMEQGYLVCCEGVCRGVFQVLPEEYRKLPVLDQGNRMIIPGMTDLHVHAPQYTFRGLGMDLELLEWLQQNTFPEEARYQNLDYAREAYHYFTQDLTRSATTRACIFATLHREATEELMDQLEQTGLVTYVGKVNMDRNGSEELCETDAVEAVQDTRRWLQEIQGCYERTMPILTPRFIPSCTDELMQGLSKISQETGLRVQSHLSENLSEVEWVRQLVPEARCYGDAYARFQMLGSKECPAVMAHCVYCSDLETELLKQHGTYIAHCAESNMNVSSGIAPVRKYLEAGIHVGLGTDVAAGGSLSLPRAMSLTMQASKMYWRLKDTSVKPLQFADVFYLATLGGGSYFGKVGSFLSGYELDAVIMDDSAVRSMRQLTIKERLERMIYQNAECTVCEKYVRGRRVY